MAKRWHVGGAALSPYLRGVMVVVLVVSIGLNVFLLGRHDKQSVTNQQASSYPLLAKRIFSENPNDVLIDFAPLRAALRQYFGQVNADYSFYFEYLFTGSSVRIDASEDDGIVAASLVKLPIVMNLYRAVELGRLQLNQEVEIQAEWLDKGFGDLWKQGAGTKITLQQAAQLALQQSDNTAVRVIQESVVPVMAEGEFALQVLDVDHVVGGDLRTKIRAKEYSSILKCLYLACFVNEDHSQQILRDLTQTSFSDRIPAGVPKDVLVAHKIGVYGDEADSDCGIVYLPNRPYLLCIMLSLPAAQANQYMVAVSRLVYDFVSDQDH